MCVVFVVCVCVAVCVVVCVLRCVCCGVCCGVHVAVCVCVAVCGVRVYGRFLFVSIFTNTLPVAANPVGWFRGGV